MHLGWKLLYFEYHLAAELHVVNDLDWFNLAYEVVVVLNQTVDKFIQNIPVLNLSSLFQRLLLILFLVVLAVLRNIFCL